jgi:hypothetical protein
MLHSTNNLVDIGEGSLRKQTSHVSIFSGIDDLIDEALSIQDAAGDKPKFTHKFAADRLSKVAKKDVGAALVSKIYSQVHQNWQAVAKKPTASFRLWVPRVQPSWSLKYKSAEVPLERSTVTIFGAYQRSDDRPDSNLMWFNQIPIAAGLVSSREGRNAIDLVCRTDRGQYDFIELKFPRLDDSSQNPLAAAMEILKNGLAYLFVISNLADIQRENHYQPKFNSEEEANWLTASPRELLDATEVNLCVLAPKRFYVGFNLGWLEEELNTGLDSFLREHSQAHLCRMSFRYEYLPNEPFEMTDGNGFRFSFTRTHLLPNQWNSLEST